MFKSSQTSAAVLPNIAGANLHPIDLGISSQFQFCVDAGAAAASAFFGSLSDFNLHDHIAIALRSFAVSVEAGMAATGNYDVTKMQECSDAFAAGYLGRIQQELRLFHCENFRRDQSRAMNLAASVDTTVMN